MSSIVNETWLPVRGFEGSYEVSDQGQVRSLDRVVTKRNGKPLRRRGQLLYTNTGHSAGYAQVMFSRRGAKGQVNRLVHRVVLEAFVGPCPEGMEGCHNDGNPFNNRLDNLRWDTILNNHQDKIRRGTTARGSRNGNSVVTEAKVREIRRFYAEGAVQTELAKQFGLNQGTVSQIVTRRTWKHVA